MTQTQDAGHRILHLWREGENFVAYDTPCPTFPGGDPCVLGEPAAIAVYWPSHLRSTSPAGEVGDVNAASFARLWANYCDVKAELADARERLAASDTEAMRLLRADALDKQ